MNSINRNSKYALQFWKEPEDQGKTVLGAIESAKYSVDISIYELGGPNILEALKTAKQNGVRIRIMYNGQFFVGADPDNGRYSQQFAMAKLLGEAPGEQAPEFQWSCNNFNITHQKTIIIDARPNGDSLPESARALVMTLNLSAYGWNMPGETCQQPCQFWGPGYPETNKGTRDFGVILTDPSLVTKIQSVFDSDFGCAPRNQTNDLKNSQDGLVWSNGTTGIQPAEPGYYPQDGAYPIYDYENLGNAVDQGNAREAHLYVIDQAKDSLIIYNEEMNDGEIVSAIKRAAERGVSVRVLLSNTYKYFQELYEAGVQIRLFPDNGRKFMYIHAKVLLSDYGSEGAIAFMGSQNISGNSLNFNRELGVLISGSEDNQLFHETFEADWQIPGLTHWQPEQQTTPEDHERQSRKYYSAKEKSTNDSNSDKPMTCGPLQS